jgi:hypothetical protein
VRSAARKTPGRVRLRVVPLGPPVLQMALATDVCVEILLKSDIDTPAAGAIFLKGFEDGWIHL